MELISVKISAAVQPMSENDQRGTIGPRTCPRIAATACRITRS
jgi:hypothetical protein